MRDEATEPEIHHCPGPYGVQERLTLNTESTVEFITIDPGQGVSLHRHAKRDERWTVLDGPLDVQIDDRAWTAATGERIRIPRGLAHRIQNPGDGPRRFLELSLGFFGEEDVERLEDSYRRLASTNR
ncbi:phosphomannose isomerase type II C-terminal cupin domain [Streptomyces sp. NPDC020731]|uniref:phosphomannose isomerase type II C-terminal cupin domain n=1 Tax=Streptomyces sp. NPDC020731 TaxID=3365085 RepID=UPI0037A99AF3